MKLKTFYSCCFLTLHPCARKPSGYGVPVVQLAVVVGGNHTAPRKVNSQEAATSATIILLAFSALAPPPNTELVFIGHEWRPGRESETSALFLTALSDGVSNFRCKPAMRRHNEGGKESHRSTGSRAATADRTRELNWPWPFRCRRLVVHGQSGSILSGVLCWTGGAASPRHFCCTKGELACSFSVTRD